MHVIDTANTQRREAGRFVDGVRTLCCVHCDEHFILTSIREEDVVLLGVLAVHLLLRHPEHFTLPADPWSAEVLQHFRAASENVK